MFRVLNEEFGAVCIRKAIFLPCTALGIYAPKTAPSSTGGDKTFWHKTLARICKRTFVVKQISKFDQNEIGRQNDPFTGGSACDAIVLFGAPLGVKPVIAPFRGCASHQFTGGLDYFFFLIL